MRVVASSFHPFIPIVNHIENCLLAIFKRTIEPFVGFHLKVCLCREAALQGRFSQWVIAPLMRSINNCWMRIKGLPNRAIPFNPARIAESEHFLSEFAEIKTIKTADGTLLQSALYTPQKFQQWVEENGGVREGEWIRPRTEQDWNRLQKLRTFKWFEEVGHCFRVPPLVPNGANKCILRCQGFGRTIGMDKAFIGLHMAAGLNYAIFNWRKEISLNGYFQDAEAAYASLRREGFSHQQIIPMGSCRATFVVARLKELHHHEGMNAVMIQSPPSLRAMIKNSPWPSNWIGMLGIGSLEKEGAHFDTLQRLRGLQRSNASTCLIMSEGDRTLPKNTINEMKEALLQSGRCELIIEPKTEGGGDPHFADPFKNRAVLDDYLRFLGS